MPRADGSIVIDTKLDTSELERGLGNLGGRFATIGKSLGGAVSAGVAAGVAALGMFTVSSIQAAEEAGKVDANLRNAIDSMGLFPDTIDKVNDRLSDYAGAISDATGVDDELIKTTQAVLFTFNDLAETADVAGGSFDRATQAAVDMAARLGGDAKGNAVLLGKALNDPIKGVTSLTRAGVQFTEQQKEQIKAAVEQNDTLTAQNIILTETEKQFKGAAEAMATASEKISVMWGNLQEDFGAAFLPVIEAVLPGVQQFLRDMAPLLVEVGEQMAAVITGVDGSEEKLTAAATKLGEFIGAGIQAAAPFVAAGLEAMLTTVAATIPAMAQTIGVLASSIIETMANSMPLYIQAVIDAMLTLVTTLADNSSQWVTPMVGAAVDIVTILAAEITKPENIETLLDAGTQIGDALLQGMRESLEGSLLGKVVLGAIESTGIGSLAGTLSGLGDLRSQAGRIGGTTLGNISQSGVLGIAGVNITNNFNQPVRTFSETIAATEFANRRFAQ